MPGQNDSLLSLFPVADRLSGFGTVHLIPTPRDDFRWLVGGYETLRGIAEALRMNATLRALVAGYQVRIGRRLSDEIPTSPKQQVGYGPETLNLDALLDHTGKRRPGSAAGTATVNQNRAALSPIIGQPVDNAEQSGLAYRYTDKFQNLKTYWEKKTPECHHIVEDNQLRALGVSNKEGNQPLDHRNLPCVLLAAEFHQKFITPILQPTRLKPNTVLDKAERPAFHRKLQGVYETMYQRNGTLLLPLWNVASIILAEAKNKL